MQPPEPLKSFLCGEHEQSQHFPNNIRRYNSAFQMSSIGAKEVDEGNYMPRHGKCVTLFGGVRGTPRNSSSCKQQQGRYTNYCCNPYGKAAPHQLVESLQSMLIEINSYIRDFKTALQSFPPNSNQNDSKIVINADQRSSVEHRGCHNEPTMNEVSV
ncbi:uncharacterized protein TNCV_3249871 [Trichonephila clavipes]|nr:uncharacterized protein TNCV_3249871 [Trichonephila clavipes]